MVNGIRKAAFACEKYVSGKSMDDVMRDYGLSSVVKLGSNENMYGPYPHALEAMRDEVSLINIYPERNYIKLKELLADKFGVADSTWVSLGHGAGNVLDSIAKTLLEEGDEVLVPEQSYRLYPEISKIMGAKVIEVPLTDRYSIDLHDYAKLLTDRTKIVWLCNPNNPTGALYPKEVLQQIVDLAREHQLMIFSDEIYDRLVMDGLEHISIASMAPDLFCVTFSGLSKSHMIAGYRVGWMILSGNKAIAKDYIEGINMLTNMRICSNVPAQSIVQTALGGHQSVHDYIVPGGRIHDQRDYIYDALNSIPGIAAVKPKAAFYIFPKIDIKKFNVHDDEQFALDLLHDKRILITRGGGFNWHEPDHFRIVYLPRIEVLKDATNKLSDFLSYYWQS